MARPTKAPQSKKPTGSTRSSGRPTATPAKTLAKPTKTSAIKPVPAVASPAAPKLSKDELRARVEALEGVNAALRVKSREANRAAKTAAARIAELEDQVAQLEKRLASAQRKSAPPAASPRKRRRREVDPGDAVPEGVAVQAPKP